MAKKSRRMIHSLGSSVSFGMLSWQAKILWPMMIAEMDDQGRFDARPKVMKWEVCQNADEIDQEDIPKLLQEMVDEGMILLYGRENRYGQMLHWWEHQPMNYARPSEYPPPDGWQDRLRYYDGEQMVTINWDSPGGFQDIGESDTPIIPPNDTPNDGGQLNLTEPNLTKTKSSKRDPRLDHPAVIGYRELARLHVPIALRDDWINCAFEVGTENLLAVVKEWIAKGYNPRNVQGMMRVAKEGWNDARGKQAASPRRREAGELSDADREYFRELEANQARPVRPET